jgi:hypothetical protein
MNQMLTCFVLAGLAASPGICQEGTVAPTKGATQMGSSSVISRFLKRSSSEEFAPFTRQERLHYYLTRSVGAGSTLSAAAGAGFQQWINTPSEWKQGSEGYRKRFANAYATHVVQGTIEYGASALLHEDNRYRRSLETGWWRRSRHAITRAFSATDDAGHQRFSYSRVGAAGAAAFIRRTWQPGSKAGVSEAVGGFAITLTGQVGVNLFREFWPDVRGHLFKDQSGAGTYSTQTGIKR